MSIISNQEDNIIKFRTADGLTLVAEAFGNPTQSPVLLLHGGGQTRHSWKQTGAILGRKGWFVLSVDSRGHGDSDWSVDKNYSMEFLARDLIQITESLVQKPILIGASMGGITGTMALKDIPDLFKALVLVDVSPKMEMKGVNRILDFMAAKPGGYHTLEEVHEAVKAYLPHRKNIGSINGLAKNLRKLPNGNLGWHWDPALLEVWKKSFTEKSAIDFESMQLEILKNLKIPTFLIRGGMSDVISEEIVSELLNTVPGLKYKDVTEAGHMVAGDSNHVFTEAVLEFLDTLR